MDTPKIKPPYDPNHRRGKLTGEWFLVDYYFKPPYTMEFISTLATDAWFDRFYREVVVPTLRFSNSDSRK